MTARLGVRWLAAVAVLIATAGLAAAQDNAVLLRYKYKPGQVLTYTSKGVIGGEMTIGANPPTPVSGSLDMRMTQKTLAVDANGVASVEARLDRMVMSMDQGTGLKIQVTAEGGKATVSMNGQPMPMPEGNPVTALFTKPVKLKIDGRGRASSLDAGGLGDIFSGVDPATMYGATPLPEGPVAPGAAWSSEMKLPLTLMGQKLETTVKYEMTFAGVEQYNGKPVARINLKSTGNTGKLGPNLPFDSMTTSLAGYTLFDYASGVVRSGQMHMEQTMNGAASDQRPATVMRMITDFNIVLAQ